jgi:hypothetical protein
VCVCVCVCVCLGCLSQQSEGGTCVCRRRWRTRFFIASFCLVAVVVVGGVGGEGVFW